ncbi:hypothetical protein B0H10DRAFT_1949908 [Mycena sp. CBHHK59/15]|nr:hypothetical protein B0H10DRAFT_1949908 [Mycena sp. CBHHK59/15]
MSEPPRHRHSQRLNGIAPSPVQELPARRSRVPRQPDPDVSPPGSTSNQNQNTLFVPPESQLSQDVGDYRYPPYSWNGGAASHDHQVGDQEELLDLNAEYTAMFIRLWDESGSSLSNPFSSSPSYPLTIPENPFVSFPPGPSNSNIFSSSSAGQLNFHSPRVIYPILRTTSGMGSTFRLSLAFNLSHVDMLNSAHSSPSASSPHNSTVIEPPLHPRLDEPPVEPPQVNPIVQPPPWTLAAVWLWRATPAPTPLQRPTPAPAPLQSAVYFGFPQHPHPARCNFLELVSLPLNPSLRVVIRTLQSLEMAGSRILNEICMGLPHQVLSVAWSRTMVEGHDPTFSSLVNGFIEVGPLRNHLLTSSVVPETAQPNPTSMRSFELRGIDLDTRLFALYIFPTMARFIEPAGILPQPQLSLPVAPVGRSRSHTPAPMGTSESAQTLAALLKIALVLDKHYLEDAFRLTILAEHTYGTAYLQIRQALIIERVFFAAKGNLSQLTLQDVAAWAGINPSTYVNNRTFVSSARATLQCLNARGNTAVLANMDQAAALKEAKLRNFLAICFAASPPAPLPEQDLTIGATSVSTLKARLLPFARFAGLYKQRIEEC